MALTLAERSGLIAPSATLAMAAEAKRLKADGVDVLDFALGEPDFGTPENIQEAAIRAMRAGQTHYTPPAGIMELRQAIARLYSQHHRSADRGGPGGRLQRGQAFDPQRPDGRLRSRRRGDHPRAVLGELLRPGQVDRRHAGRDPDPRGEWIQADARAVPRGDHARTKLLMINSPSNPTGVVYSRGELEALADAVLEVDHLGVISDEIYEQLLYGDAQATCFATLRAGLAARTITISGVSKTYAMTGWRIGWSVAPAAVAKFMGDLQSQETSNPCSISQWAALEAVHGPARLGRRNAGPVHRAAGLRSGADRRLARGDLRAAGRGVLRLHEHFGPPGTYLGRARHHRLDGLLPAALASVHVALVMGSAFGAEGYARLSFATDKTTLERGFDAIEKFLQG